MQDNIITYEEFERIMSQSRMNRYLNACNGQKSKALTLYEKNIQLSQGLFTLISFHEITLRNAINDHCLIILGKDWLLNSISSDGVFNSIKTEQTKKAIEEAVKKLNKVGIYNHNNLITELGYGFWRYLFASNQYRSLGNNLLRIFSNKPKSNKSIQYNNKLIFNNLAKINEVRNRIAHHEPICFEPNKAVISTVYARKNYALIHDMFTWMGIDSYTLLQSVDSVIDHCNEIDSIKSA